MKVEDVIPESYVTEEGIYLLAKDDMRMPNLGIRCKKHDLIFVKFTDFWWYDVVGHFELPHDFGFKKD